MSQLGLEICFHLSEKSPSVFESSETNLSFYYIEALSATDKSCNTKIKKCQFFCGYLIVAKALKVKACQNISKILYNLVSSC